MRPTVARLSRTAARINVVAIMPIPINLSFSPARRSEQSAELFRGGGGDGRARAASRWNL
jgi:hypothetical protein